MMGFEWTRIRWTIASPGEWKMWHKIASALVALTPLPALAQDIPPCALTGSTTVTIGGKPALKLSDVVNCPAGFYEIIPSVTIEGQPMVHFRSGVIGKMRCIGTVAPTVQVDGEHATTAGATHCTRG